MKTIKRLITTLSLVLALTLPTIAAPLAFAVDPPASPTDNAVSSACDAIGCSTDNGPSVGSILRLVLNFLSILIGIVAVIMIIFSGFRFVTSSGDSSKVASARNAIMYALIGLVIAALAQVMVHYVLKQVNNAALPSYQSCQKDPTITDCPSAAQCSSKSPPANCPPKKKK